jgi:hypothetical protein
MAPGRGAAVARLDALLARIGRIAPAVRAAAGDQAVELDRARLHQHGAARGRMDL